MANANGWNRMNKQIYNLLLVEKYIIYSHLNMFQPFIMLQYEMEIFCNSK